MGEPECEPLCVYTLRPFSFTMPLPSEVLLPSMGVLWEYGVVSGDWVWSVKGEVFHESDLRSHFQKSARLMCTHCPFQFHCPASYLRVYQPLFQCWILYAWLEQAQTHRFVDCWINSWSKVIPTKYLCELESWSFLARKLFLVWTMKNNIRNTLLLDFFKKTNVENQI